MPLISQCHVDNPLTTARPDPKLCPMSIPATSVITRQRMAMCICMDMCIARVRVGGHEG